MALLAVCVRTLTAAAVCSIEMGPRKSNHLLALAEQPPRKSTGKAAQDLAKAGAAQKGQMGKFVQRIQKTSGQSQKGQISKLVYVGPPRDTSASSSSMEPLPLFESGAHVETQQEGAAFAAGQNPVETQQDGQNPVDTQEEGAAFAAGQNHVETQQDEEAAFAATQPDKPLVIIASSPEPESQDGAPLVRLIDANVVDGVPLAKLIPLVCAGPEAIGVVPERAYQAKDIRGLEEHAASLGMCFGLVPFSLDARSQALGGRALHTYASIYI